MSECNAVVFSDGPASFRCGTEYDGEILECDLCKLKKEKIITKNLRKKLEACDSAGRKAVGVVINFSEQLKEVRNRCHEIIAKSNKREDNVIWIMEAAQQVEQSDDGNM